MQPQSDSQPGLQQAAASPQGGASVSLFANGASAAAPQALQQNMPTSTSGISRFVAASVVEPGTRGPQQVDVSSSDNASSSINASSMRSASALADELRAIASAASGGVAVPPLSRLITGLSSLSAAEGEMELSFAIKSQQSSGLHRPSSVMLVQSCMAAAAGKADAAARVLAVDVVRPLLANTESRTLCVIDTDAPSQMAERDAELVYASKPSGTSQSMLSNPSSVCLSLGNHTTPHLAIEHGVTLLSRMSGMSGMSGICGLSVQESEAPIPPEAATNNSGWL